MILEGKGTLQKILVPLYGQAVAPRFDLATEVLIAVLKENGGIQEERTVVLPHGSADDLCRLILSEAVDTVICGGIEDEYYQYLRWKKVQVLDSVVGPARRALELLRQHDLSSDQVIPGRPQD
jgi:predicted Fe-Mo cluster-binding NifX family protein